MTYVSSLENVVWPYLLLGILLEEGVDIEPATSEILNMDLDDLHYQYLTMMEQSKIKAEYIAREYMGEEPELILAGFYPIHYIPDWPDKDKIKVSDIVVGMDGIALESFGQMDQLILNKQSNEEMVLQLIRDEKELDVTVQTYPERDYDNNTVLGVYLEPIFELEEDKRIQFSMEEVGGPSAGLMLTLTLLEKMTEESLLKGNKVAGTGTIEMTGEVGPIGGVRQKVIGADLAGYDYFIVPADNEFSNNEEIARRTVAEEGLSIHILPVATLDEAVEALKGLPKK